MDAAVFPARRPVAPIRAAAGGGLALLAAAAILASARPAAAQDAGGEATGYRTPHPAITRIVDAPPTPAVSLSPDGARLLVIESPGYPPLADFTRPELKLAGLRIRPDVDGRSRTTGAAGLRLVDVASGDERAVSGLPEEPRLENFRWSPDGRHVAFTHTTRTEIELWVLAVEAARARRVIDARLSLVAGNPPAWLDPQNLVAALVPEGRGPAPAAGGLPAGPVIEEAAGRRAPARTYQDLLENPHDEALFDHYFTVRIARVGLDGTVAPLAGPGIAWDFEPSPDGRFVLLQWLHRPYSYRVPAYRFPRRVEVLDRDGEQVRLVADLPLQDEVPIAFGSVPTGPRSFTWRADAPATLLWAEARDGGDASVEAEIRDELLLLAAPFDGEPRSLATLGLRYAGVRWGGDDLALVTESWWKTRRQRVWRVRPGEPGSAPELLFDRSYEDRYSDPGSPETRTNEYGREVILRSPDGGSMYLIGAGASPEGDRPFLDRFDLAAGTAMRLFRSQAPWYEVPVEFLDPEAGVLLSRRESPDEPPNYVLRDLAGGEPRAVTAFPHPAPELREVRKELVRYRRADGVDLSGTLYLPPDWTPGDGLLPTLLWAYPTEYKSADAAGQVTDSPYRFVRPSAWSSYIWTLLGYAVFDDPSLPIIGEGDEEPNDTYIQQLVAGAEAAVRELVRREVADPARVAIGGHSYGAFMTANLLAHSDLFAAGIARSGAYNRTLTPFGFQAEERTYWEAPEIYYAMSPFMHADAVDEPILLIHGEMDNNSGTFPMQSERFFGALKGLGATARLVVLPFESHGYRARESLLHMLWEQERWLETHVRGTVSAARSGDTDVRREGGQR
ncbi:MAG: alpha/beta fold hydrolase [Gemmatimonadota bacterium]|nr:alpha/beta fold hydrolase [Gemmatimonadota bacterium]